MTRVVPAPLLTALTGSPLAGECLVLAARDGTRAGFTTLDRAQTVDVGAGDETCDEGMNISAITLAAGLDASFAEVSGPLGPVLTRAEVQGGRWDGAEAWLVRVSPGVAGLAPLLYGKVREARVEGAQFVLEIRNQGDDLNQPLVVEVTPYCNTTYASPQCGLIEVPVDAVVSAVTDALRFAVTFTGTYADDYFNLGKVSFVDGVLQGVESDLLFDWVSGGAGHGSLVLREPLWRAPEVGDALELRRGCGRTRAACMAYGNMINFRGEPDVSGSDQVLTAPVPEA